MEVDLVYLWVNGNDPVWKAKHDAVAGITDESGAGNCEGRYADNDELKYSLRAVEQYAPWIRRIFIVTDNQTPSWLDTSNPKIRIIDHKEILQPENLPTFNSVAIEHQLHKIPGLAEHFLYANDDMYFNRPVKQSDFFTSDGMPIIRLNRRPLRKLSLWLQQNLQGKELSNYNKTILRAGNIVKEKTGKYFGAKPHHNIDAFCRTQYEETFETFKTEIEPTLSNRLRSDNDIQRVIYSYYPLAAGKARGVYVTQKTSFRLHTHRHNHYSKLERFNPMLFCLNDSQYATEGDREMMLLFLKRRFPTPSSFERS